MLSNAEEEAVGRIGFGEEHCFSLMLRYIYLCLQCICVQLDILSSEYLCTVFPATPVILGVDELLPLISF